MDTRTTDVIQRMRELNIDPTTVLAVHPHTSANLGVKSNISRSHLDTTPLNFNTAITPTTATTFTNAQANANFNASVNGNNNGNTSANANANTNTNADANEHPPLASDYRTRRREYHARLAAWHRPGALGLDPSEHARARRKSELEEMVRQRRIFAAGGDSVVKAQVAQLEGMIDALQALQ
ncbi:hypothetical protein B0H65DRAFT_547333 [Neurospora tetraspora]|uniref:Uncharacterized protein n=1 Tax=Neurospora tetraspora TaxID=94610 RepID=A0AAE0JHC0_9PEZI|nr:hypothetical protein B0H65DRAFT_547333 [Neurospora tetraspora]